MEKKEMIDNYDWAMILDMRMRYLDKKELNLTEDEIAFLRTLFLKEWLKNSTTAIYDGTFDLSKNSVYGTVLLIYKYYEDPTRTSDGITIAVHLEHRLSRSSVNVGLMYKKVFKK